MSRQQRRLRFRVLTTHVLVALSGAITSLLTGAILALVLPPPSPSDAASRLPVVVAACAAAGLAVSGVVALAASNRLFDSIAAPVRRMTKLARGMAKGNYSQRVALPDVAEVASPQTAQGEGHVAAAGAHEMDEVIGGLAAAIDALAASLEAAEHRRTMSFGEITHEMRTPVAVLEGYLEGLLDGHVKPSEETWALLYDEAGRVHRMVDELQALSRAEARRSPPELQAVDPAAIARGALERLRLPFGEKGLQVNTDISPGLPLVLADPDQALQALVNLLTNALRYTPSPGQVTLSVKRLDDTNEVVFSVQDTGMGIAAEHIPYLFERFFRIDRGGSRQAGGSGIGLPVAKALIEAMGGRIWAESPGVGKGSTFSFTLLVSGGVPSVAS
ncbi:MAG TPA: ATP-binding protein [Chloroflexia bacterium]|nr:ATP-binding protein [Chloroflexia bacterium]